MVEAQPNKHSIVPEAPGEKAEAGVIARIVPQGMKPEESSCPNPSEGADSEAQGFQLALRPILQGIEAVARAQFEQVDILDRFEKVMMHQAAVPKILTETKTALEQRNVVNRAMFEALHTELKAYKDAFILEAVLRPVIRDLISLYDDVSEIHRQLALALSTQEQRGNLAGSALILFETVAAPVNQLEHNRDAIIEVLERLDVTMLPPGTGRLDKLTQRAVAVENAVSADQDNEVIKIVKRGFQWKDRIVRAEEVVVRKWKEGRAAGQEKSDPKT